MKPRSRNMKMDLACGNASFVGLDVYRDCEKPRIPCRQLGLLTDGGRIFEQSDIEAGFVKRAKEMGGDGLLNDPELVANIRQHGDDTEVLLVPGASPQELLKRLVESGATVTRFELVEPSLHDIFIEKVREVA